MLGQGLVALPGGDALKIEFGNSAIASLPAQNCRIGLLLPWQALGVTAPQGCALAVGEVDVSFTIHFERDAVTRRDDHGAHFVGASRSQARI